jgi:predicted lipid-binding transport protein (Tim44 family)
MGGLLFASFLAHIFGFIGPFAALGIIFVVYAVFLEKIIFFLPKSQEQSQFKNRKDSNEILSKDES